MIDKLERQTVDHREKPRIRARPLEEKHLLSRLADGTADAGRPRRIVKTKRFAIEPMFEEDAIAEMEELGHGSSCSSTPRTSSSPCYRRSDGDFGLIEPVIGGARTSGVTRPGPSSARDRRARAV